MVIAASSESPGSQPETAAPRCELAAAPDPDGRIRLKLMGQWQLNQLEPAERELAAALHGQPAAAQGVVLDGSALQALDTAGALAIVCALRRDLAARTSAQAASRTTMPGC
jgi:hypothetical protein